MLYLKNFTFPTDGEEFDVIINVKEKYYSSFYPFKILSQRGIEKIDFEPVTIFYGSNGSGNPTAKALLCTLRRKLKKTRCTCLMSRKTAFRRKNKWNWCAFWRIRRVFTAASLSLQHIHHLCFR